MRQRRRRRRRCGSISTRSSSIATRSCSSAWATSTRCSTKTPCRARALELTLTSRSKDANGGGIPMCGVPFHAVDGYIARLVKKGFRVAICDQVEDPRKAKGLVKREVVRVVSPGTLTDANYLDAREPAFLMAVAPGRRRRPRRRAARPVDRRVHRGRIRRRRRHAGARRRARRAQAARDHRAAADGGADAALRHARAVAAIRHGLPMTPVDAWAFEPEARAAHAARSAPRGRPRGLRPRRPSGRGRRPPARSCTICATRRRSTSRTCARSPTGSAPTRCSSIRRRSSIWRSSKARRAAATGSLLDELDRTVTSIGSRLLRSWLLRPLVALEPIRDRLDAVEELAFRTTERGKFRDAIKAVQDLERLVARAALGTAGPRDLVGLKQSLGVIPARAHGARRAAGAAGPLAARRARRPGRRARRDRGDAHRRAAGAGARRRVRPRRRRPRARRAAHHQPVGQAGHRRDGRARARAHRHRVAEGPLQPRVRATTSRSRSRTCTPCRPTTTASRRSPAASASSRRR